MSQPSEHFTWHELTRSQVADRNGWPNDPDLACQNRLIDLCTHVLEPVRDHFGPVYVSSAYRSPDVNRAVGGAPSSQHTLGMAADIEVGTADNIELAAYIRDHLPFDQLILEFYRDGDPHSGWVHVSYCEGKNRGQTLVARRNPAGRTIYTPGLPS